MKKRVTISVLTISVVMFAMLHFYCQLFDPPTAPEKTDVSAVFKASNGQIYKGSLVDSVGKVIEIGAALYLPDNFDSLSIKVLDGENVVINEMSRSFKNGYFYDTVWVKNTFWTPGVKNVTITPFSNPERLPIVTTITIQGVSQNIPPQWSVDTLRRSIKVGTQLFQALSEVCSDANNEKITYTLLPGEPENDTIIETTYQFNPTIVGTFIAQIKASDAAGTFVILPVKITVDNVSEDKQAPEITFITPTDTNATVAVDSFTIDLLCTDASGVASVSATLGTTTFQSNFKNGHYLIPVKGFTKGTVNIVTISAKDSSSLGNTNTRKLYFNYSTAIPPFTVTYNGNTNTAGAAPVDPGKYEIGALVTVKDNTGNMVKVGYTFVGWNTKADGSGPGYASGVTFPMGTANVMLYAQWTTKPTFTVTYNGNGNTGGTVPADLNNYGTAATVTVKENTGLLVKTGATFAGWNTTVDGSGTAYASGVTFPMGSANVTLYAQWTTKPTFTVTYDGNGNTGGTVPADANKYETAATVTVKQNTGLLVKTGATFAGWNTKADGSGTAYAAGVTFPMVSANVMLFAQWTTKPTFTVTYDGNGNTGGTVPTDANKYETAATVTVKENTGLLVKTGLTFSGWNTKVDGSGTAYAAGVTFPMGSADVTLYAQWTTKPTFTVTYDGNGNTGGTVPADANKYETAATVTVKENTGLLVKTGSTFAGWNTAANGSGAAYAAGVTFPIGSANVTLYAQWTTKPTFTVTYNGNGNTSGTVPADANKYETAAAVTVKDNTGLLAKTGSTFAGWNTAADGSGTSYVAAATFPMGSANVILYAKWTTNPTYTVTYNGNGNTGGVVPTDTSKYEAAATITVKANTGSLVRAGFTFNGWNTVADGSGTAYTAAATFPMGSANITLYAQWTLKPTFTVIYGGNGNTGGAVPTDTTKYETAATVTVKGNTGSLVRTGFTFTGWNTAADGSGTPYAVNATFPMGNANVTLHAQWTLIPSFTVTFNSNGGSGTMSSQSIVSGTSAPLTANTFTKVGSTFTGWASSATGTTVEFPDRANYTMGGGNVTLYAVWVKKQYILTYDGNSASTGTAPGPYTYDSNTTVTISANTGNLLRTNYSFNGWNSLASGSGTPYAAGSSFVIKANTTIFAKWDADPTVSYNANGATGTPPTGGTYKAGATVTVAGTGSLSKTRYVFDGWNTQADGKGTKYDANQTFTMSSTSVILYARWAPSGMVRITSGSFQMGQTDVTNATPVHTVTLTKNFWMDQTEVTQKDYHDLMVATYGASASVPDWASSSYGSGDRFPAYGVTWDMALLYCNARTKATGSTDTVYTYTSINWGTSQIDGVSINISKNGFRLPNEAEWEYACRAGSSTNYYWGNSTTNIGTYASWSDNSNGIHYYVGLRSPNSYGLYDMAGSVAEWCNDYSYDYVPGAQVDPLAINTTSSRMLRGGSISSTEEYLYSAYRVSTYSFMGSAEVGFRVAKNSQW